MRNKMEKVREREIIILRKNRNTYTIRSRRCSDPLPAGSIIKSDNRIMIA